MEGLDTLLFRDGKIRWVTHYTLDLNVSLGLNVSKIQKDKQTKIKKRNLTCIKFLLSGVTVKVKRKRLRVFTITFTLEDSGRDVGNKIEVELRRCPE